MKRITLTKRKEKMKDGYKKEHKMELGEDMPKAAVKREGGLEKVTLHGSGSGAYPKNKKLCHLGY